MAKPTRSPSEGRESRQCALDGCSRLTGTTGDLCILHDPSADKCVSDFDAALASAVDDCLASTLSVDGKTITSLAARTFNASNVVFPAGADLEWLDGASGLCLDDATFLGDVALIGANFPLGVSAQNTLFEGTVHFSECEFDSVLADNAVFKHDVTFQDCLFTSAFFTGHTCFMGDAYFSFSTFASGLFQRVIFHKRADFTEATVINGLNFEDCDLGPDMCFGEADLKGGLTFRDCQTAGDVSFAGSRIGSRLLLENLQHKGFVDFRRVRIGPDGDAVFLRVKMDDVLLTGTSMERAEFQDVSWPELPTAGSTRRAVADEVRWPAPVSEGLAFGNERFGHASMAELELLYRQLKKVFDDRADYETAGDFHVGEFEAKLKSNRLPRSNRALIKTYRAISFYGERWLRPLILLAIWLGLFTVVMLFAGLNVANRPIQYGLAGTFDPGRLARDAWLTFLYGIQVAIAMRPTDVFVTGWFARTTVVLTNIVGPTLVALFILALRRQTRR